MSVLTLEAKLERTESSTPWGFRLAGGKDFSSPLTIQRVDYGSLAAKCGLLVGDIILKIGNLSTEPLRHKEAKENILACGNHLDLLVQRGGNAGYDRFNGPQINTNWNAGPAQMSNGAPPAPQASQNFNNAPKPFNSAPPPQQQFQNLSLTNGGPPPVNHAPAPAAPAYRYQ